MNDRIRRLRANANARNLWSDVAEGAINSRRELRELIDLTYSHVEAEEVRDWIESEALELAKSPVGKGLSARTAGDEKALEWAARLDRADHIRPEPDDLDNDVDAHGTGGAVRQGNDPDWMDSIKFEDGTGLRSGDDQ